MKQWCYYLQLFVFELCGAVRRMNLETQSTMETLQEMSTLVVNIKSEFLQETAREIESYILVVTFPVPSLMI